MSVQKQMEQIVTRIVKIVGLREESHNKKLGVGECQDCFRDI